MEDLTESIIAAMLNYGVTNVTYVLLGRVQG